MSGPGLVVIEPDRHRQPATTGLGHNGAQTVASGVTSPVNTPIGTETRTPSVVVHQARGGLWASGNDAEYRVVPRPLPPAVGSRPGVCQRQR